MKKTRGQKSHATVPLKTTIYCTGTFKLDPVSNPDPASLNRWVFYTFSGQTFILTILTKENLKNWLTFKHKIWNGWSSDATFLKSQKVTGTGYCPTTANWGQKWYQSTDNVKLNSRPFSFFHFKGTPPQEEHRTFICVSSIV